MSASLRLRDRNIEIDRRPNKGVCHIFCGTLEVDPKSDQFDYYFDIAKMLRQELKKIDGFVDNARYAGLTRPGWLLSLSSRRDEKSLVRWSVETNHHKAVCA
jgi:hypothetical protein